MSIICYVIKRYDKLLDTKKIILFFFKRGDGEETDAETNEKCSVIQ